ncbi:hypothetical protein CVT26_007917, partial [Gymnopilus dilepis]
MPPQPRAPPEKFPFGEVDCWGIPRTAQGTAKFKSNCTNPAELVGTDALVIAETSLSYRVAGLQRDADTGLLPNGFAKPRFYFITSANMTWIPETMDDTTKVYVRKDGRYGTHDFTQWPQWFFEGTWYYPYVMRKPDEYDMPEHPYRLLWYNLKPEDFVKEPGAVSEIGMIRQDLMDQLVALKLALNEKVQQCMADNGFTLRSEEFRPIHHSNKGQRFANIALGCAPQSWLMTLLTFTSFQRHSLEVLALLDYYSKWKAVEESIDGTPRPVDTS